MTRPTFADRHLPLGVGQAPSSPTSHGKAVGSSWGDRRPEVPGPVTAGAAFRTARPPRVDTTRPTIVIDGVEHTLTPGWRWPARATRTETT